MNVREVNERCFLQICIGKPELYTRWGASNTDQPLGKPKYRRELTKIAIWCQQYR